RDACGVAGPPAQHDLEERPGVESRAARELRHEVHALLPRPSLEAQQLAIDAHRLLRSLDEAGHHPDEARQVEAREWRRKGVGGHESEYPPTVPAVNTWVAACDATAGASSLASPPRLYSDSMRRPSQPEDTSMTQTRLNRRLTTLDSTFLYFEKAEQPMHIGGCMLYEGRISRDDLARTLLGRLHRLPRYRQKVVFPPFTLTHPTWEDDPDFDIANHLDEVTLPAPADDRVLAEVGGR